MSSKRDLVEAHSFNRRRLISAFVSGAPGGREVEPVRYGRTLVGGLVLAVLVVAGSAVSGFLKPAVPENWLDNGLVVGKSSGSRFVAYKGTLYPVINTTSARLILATEGDLSVNFIPDDKIAAEKQGPTIGIAGAPDILPAVPDLVSTGWSACTNDDGGIKVVVATRPAVEPETDRALLVRARGKQYVVSGQHRYQLPASSNRAATLRALRLDGEVVRDVDGRWLDLVSPGSALRPFTVAGQGRRVDTGVRGLDRVGAPVLVDGRPYVLGGEKKLLELTDFAYSMYRSSGPGAAFPELELGLTDVNGLSTDSDPGSRPFPEDWPAEGVRAFADGQSPCALMRASQDEAPYAVLAGARDESATTSGTGTVRSVQAGHGALVRASTGGVVGAGTAFLVDSTGTRYAVGQRGDEQSAMVSLGYGQRRPTPAPRAWVDLFADGPALSAGAASQVSGGQ